MEFRFYVDSDFKGKGIFAEVSGERASATGDGKIYAIAFDKKTRQTLNESVTEFVAYDWNFNQCRQKLLELPENSEFDCKNLQFTFVINMIMEDGYTGEEFVLRDV